MLPLSQEELDEMMIACQEALDIMAAEAEQQEKQPAPEPKKFIKINLLKRKGKKKSKVSYKELQDIIESQG